MNTRLISSALASSLLVAALLLHAPALAQPADAPNPQALFNNAVKKIKQQQKAQKIAEIKAECLRRFNAGQFVSFNLKTNRCVYHRQYP